MTEWDGKGLVSTAWLEEHLGDPDLRIFDTTVHLRPATPGPYRVESGRADYETAHIPGAAFLDLAHDFSDHNSSLGFTMPAVSDFAEACGKAGIGPQTRVVVYSTPTPIRGPFRTAENSPKKYQAIARRHIRADQTSPGAPHPGQAN